MFKGPLTPVWCLCKKESTPPSRSPKYVDFSLTVIVEPRRWIVDTGTRPMEKTHGAKRVDITTLRSWMGGQSHVFRQLQCVRVTVHGSSLSLRPRTLLRILTLKIGVLVGHQDHSFRGVSCSVTTPLKPSVGWTCPIPPR